MAEAVFLKILKALHYLSSQVGAELRTVKALY